MQRYDLLQQLVAQLPWVHNILLIQKVKDINQRHWYMQQTIENGWSRNILALQIDSNAYTRQGKAVTRIIESKIRAMINLLKIIEVLENYISLAYLNRFRKHGCSRKSSNFLYNFNRL